MAVKRTAEEVVNKLRQADVDLSKGNTVATVCKLIGASEQTYHRWRSAALRVLPRQGASMAVLA